MNNISELIELLRTSRLEKGISYKDLKEKTKIPSDIIQKIEENPDFVEKNVYARMFLKQLLKELGINAQIKAYEKKDTEIDNSDFISQKTGKLINASLTATALSGLIFMSLAFKTEKTSDEVEAYKIILQTKVEKEYTDISNQNLSEESLIQKAKSIRLIAKSDVWITANIDGELEVINLRSGDKVDISFFKKVVFETIGNAMGLTMMFDNREVVIRKQIAHNVFVDKNGIFLNGYNLIKES